MRKIPVIGKDLHHPYSVLVIFMVMMVLSAYTHRADENAAVSMTSEPTSEENVNQGRRLNLNDYLEHSRY